jgi:hypothetical protein
MGSCQYGSICNFTLNLQLPAAAPVRLDLQLPVMGKYRAGDICTCSAGRAHAVNACSCAGIINQLPMPARLLQLLAKHILLAGPALWVHNHSCGAISLSWVYWSVSCVVAHSCWIAHYCCITGCYHHLQCHSAAMQGGLLMPSYSVCYASQCVLFMLCFAYFFGVCCHELLAQS